MNIYTEFAAVKKNEPKFNNNQSEQLLIDIDDIITFNTLDAISAVRGYVLDCIAEDRTAEVIINICIDRLYVWDEIEMYFLKFEIFKRYLEDVYIKSKNLNVYINFRGIYQMFNKDCESKNNPITPLLLTKFTTNFDIDNIFIDIVKCVEDNLNSEQKVLTIINNLKLIQNEE